MYSLGVSKSKRLLLSVLLGITVTSAYAAKPEWAGQNKGGDGIQAEQHRAVMQNQSDEEAEARRKIKQEQLKREHNAKEQLQDRRHNNDEFNELDKNNPDNKGIDKQRLKKAEQEQKELGRGSEQGQEAREQRKKWWRFW